MAEQVAGYVRPGSQVAIYATYRLITADGKAITFGTEGDGIKGTAVLLPKVEVIAVGPHGEGATTTTPIDGEGEAQDGQGNASVLVTVAASAEEAAKIIHVAESNAIYLALLNDSSDIQPGVGVDSRNIFS
jgi:pilus assembly protein CpaB